MLSKMENTILTSIFFNYLSMFDLIGILTNVIIGKCYYWQITYEFILMLNIIFI